MAVIDQSVFPTHAIPGATFTTLASPSLGTTTGSVWRVRIDPGVPSPPHQLTSEEIFVVASGGAHGTIGAHEYNVREGQTLVVPPGVDFVLNADDDGFDALVYLAAGGQAMIGGGEPFTPPWAR
jgi:mannose-6-phosphate isomerase-like protein (cupin superfamily)